MKVPEQIGGIPVIISRGTPYEIGLNHGKRAAERVRASFEFNYRTFRTDLFTREELEAVSLRFAENVRSWNPDYIEEIRGIADGSGMSFTEIMMLNCRTELQKMVWNKKDAEGKLLGADGCEWDRGTESCTSVAVCGSLTADGCTYAGQNWDGDITVRPNMIYHVLRQENGKPDIAYCGEAGIICRSGINSYGIGDGVNSLNTNGPVDFTKIPLQFILRGVLDAKDLAFAADAANYGRGAAVNSILIAQKDGDALNVEMDHGCCGITYSEDGILAHANHYVSPGHPRYPYLERGKGNSFVRHGRVNRLLREIPGKITMEDVERILSDHGNAPSCICRHDDPLAASFKGSKGVTVFSYLANLTTLEVHLAPEEPCKGYIRFRPFDWLSE